MTIAIDTQGLHPATELFLEILQELQEEGDFRAILDMGCGNGILSVVAAAIWDAQVVAVDISPKALEDAARNIAANDLGDQVTLLRSDGFAHPAIREHSPYDLIFFNCLAEPIVSMALQLQACLRPGGLAIVGGILAWKAPELEAYYASLGFITLRRFSQQQWHAFVFQSKSALH